MGGEIFLGDSEPTRPEGILGYQIKQNIFHFGIIYGFQFNAHQI